MIVLVDDGASANVERALKELGLWPKPLGGVRGASGFSVAPWSVAVDVAQVAAIAGVREVLRAPSAHPLLDEMPRVVDVAGVRIGARAAPVLIAGPCSVEGEEQIARIAHAVASSGARLLRGGAFKPRTSPRGFSGHGAPALRWMRAAADAAGLGLVTEAVSERDVDDVAAVADMLQVGARSMHSSALLKAVGAARKPVLLKRGFVATLDEWCLAAEALLLAGAPGVVFCERGVRGFDPTTRNVLDVGAVAALAHQYGLPVVVDPSHAAGRRDLVVPLARAGLAAGAHGVVVEVHDRPGEALTDAPQALEPALLHGLIPA